jgi:hypothetical protein
MMNPQPEVMLRVASLLKATLRLQLVPSPTSWHRDCSGNLAPFDLLALERFSQGPGSRGPRLRPISNY